METHHQVSISFKTIMLFVGFLLLCWVLFMIREAVILLLIALLLATALYPIANRITTTRLPRKLSILMVYLLLILISAGIISMLGNVLYTEGQQFLERLPEYAENATERLYNIPFLKSDPALLTNLSNYIGNITNRVVSVALFGLNYIFTVLHAAISLLSILIFSFYLLSDATYFESVFLRLIPQSRQEEVRCLLRETALNVGTYVRGQFIVMLLTGGLTWLGLSIVGVPYAFILGLIVFLLDIIPIVGPLVASTFGIVIALGQSPTMALWAALVYFVVQQIESYVLSPYILGRSVGIHPFWILISLLTGGLLMGVPGVILAVPAAITLGLLVETYYIKRYLKNP